MRSSLVNLARRAVTVTAPNPYSSSSHIWRCYCSSKTSPANSSPTTTNTNNNNKLFAAGLSWSVDEKSLKNAFSSFGEVTEVNIIYDKETGRSRGFGFVNFSKEDEASFCQRCNGWKGRPLRITFALSKVRGGPVVVPRLTSSRHIFGRT